MKLILKEISARALAAVWNNNTSFLIETHMMMMMIMKTMMTTVRKNMIMIVALIREKDNDGGDDGDDGDEDAVNDKDGGDDDDGDDDKATRAVSSCSPRLVGPSQLGRETTVHRAMCTLHITLLTTVHFAHYFAHHCALGPSQPAGLRDHFALCNSKRTRAHQLASSTAHQVQVPAVQSDHCTAIN